MHSDQEVDALDTSWVEATAASFFTFPCAEELPVISRDVRSRISKMQSKQLTSKSVCFPEAKVESKPSQKETMGDEGGIANIFFKYVMFF